MTWPSVPFVAIPWNTGNIATKKHKRHNLILLLLSVPFVAIPSNNGLWPQKAQKAQGKLCCAVGRASGRRQPQLPDFEAPLEPFRELGLVSPPASENERIHRIIASDQRKHSPRALRWKPGEETDRWLFHTKRTPSAMSEIAASSSSATGLSSSNAFPCGRIRVAETPLRSVSEPSCVRGIRSRCG